MSNANSEAIVSTEWLAQHLSAPDVRVVDASWNHPSTGKNARTDYDETHIPGAVYFDIDDIATKPSPLPHMLPEAAKFASKVRKLGLGNGNRIIVYDRSAGGAAAARVWWMFRLFGHHDISILDGGLEKWQREGRPTEDLPPMPRDRHFMPRVNQLLARDLEQMKAVVASGREQIVDARPPGRFNGTETDPWPSKKSGHMPGAKNLPWTQLLDPESKTLLPPDAIAAKFKAAGIDVTKPVVASCGSGVTACVLALGLYLVGNTEAAVYDGSWAEWGLAEDTPVAAE